MLAYTNGGDGVRSPVYTSTTEEDLPGAPGSVKALAMSQDSILVSWQHPEEPNGKVLQYTVYIKVMIVMMMMMTVYILHQGAAPE